MESGPGVRGSLGASSALELPLRRATFTVLSLVLLLAGCEDEPIRTEEIAGDYFGWITVTFRDRATWVNDSRTVDEARTVRHLGGDRVAIPAVGCELECVITSRGSYWAHGEISDSCTGTAHDGSPALWTLVGTCYYSSEEQLFAYGGNGTAIIGGVTFDASAQGEWTRID